jgi:hypothetical protein
MGTGTLWAKNIIEARKPGGPVFFDREHFGGHFLDQQNTPDSTHFEI